MKKTFKIKDLDCAHCAGKMQDAINKLDGVNEAEVNFLLSKFVLDADDDKFDDILAQTKKIVKKIEPDCVFVI